MPPILKIPFICIPGEQVILQTFVMKSLLWPTPRIPKVDLNDLPTSGISGSGSCGGQQITWQTLKKCSVALSGPGFKSGTLYMQSHPW